MNLLKMKCLNYRSRIVLASISTPKLGAQYCQLANACFDSEYQTPGSKWHSHSAIQEGQLWGKNTEDVNVCRSRHK